MWEYEAIKCSTNWVRSAMSVSHWEENIHVVAIQVVELYTGSGLKQLNQIDNYMRVWANKQCNDVVSFHLNCSWCGQKKI